MTNKNTGTHNMKLRLKLSEQRFLLVLGDFIAASLALLIALYVWASGDSWYRFSIEFLKYRAPAWFYLLPIMWVILMVDTYDSRKSANLRQTLRGIGLVFLASTIVYLVIYFAVEPNSLPRLGVAVFIIAATLLTLFWRLIYIRTFTSVSRQQRVVIVGAGKAGTALVGVISELDPPPFKLIGLIDDDPAKLGTNIQGFPILGNHENMAEVITNQGITDLILAISNEMNHGMFQSILTAQEDGVNLTTMTETYESLSGRVPIDLLESDWVVRAFLDRAPTSGFYRIAKRLVDLLLGLLGLVVLAILSPLLAPIILLDSGSPVIFTQIRLGRGGKPYTIYKLRTMKSRSDMEKEALVTTTNDPRITRIGRFLRKSHLDELPQIINVLRGEMSFVGPRSERVELVQVFQKEVPFYRARMLVKPGITGWAQIHQPYAETIKETATKLQYDLYYIEHASIWMDLNILLRTVGSVLGFKGR
ncbi:MAG TPA: sugar transferase [Anaerolineaceae bacterium]|nr:sugar transferase [Anaerolineaceae bacterium]